MRVIYAAVVVALMSSISVVVATNDASAQATCRQKCIDEEQACLKRTGNKSQCGQMLP